MEKVSVVKDFLTTAADGKNYHTLYYNLDVIISVGYRVKSLRGTHFRQWAASHSHRQLRGRFGVIPNVLKAQQRISM